MKKNIITILFLFFTTILMASDECEYIGIEQTGKLLLSEHYNKNKPIFTPVFIINGKTYEIKDDAIYVKDKKIDMGNNFFIDDKDHIIYNIWIDNVNNIIYFYKYWADEPGYNFYIRLYDINYDKYKEYYLSDLCPYDVISYIENNEYHIACLNVNIDTDIQNDKVEYTPVISILKPTMNDIKIATKTDINITFNTKQIHNNYHKLTVKYLNRDKVKLLKNDMSFKFKDNKSGLLYSQKCVAMYENYYWAKTLVKEYGKCGCLPFGEFDLNYDISNYTEKEKSKIYTGCDTKNTNILTIDNFCKNII